MKNSLISLLIIFCCVLIVEAYGNEKHDVRIETQTEDVFESSVYIDLAIRKFRLEGKCNLCLSGSTKNAYLEVSTAENNHLFQHFFETAKIDLPDLEESYSTCIEFTD